MLLYTFLILICVATACAIKDWRKGVFLMIIAGIIKDPIRKMVPDAPAYLALATVPIWGAILIGALIENPDVVKKFKIRYQRLTMALIIFLLSAVPAAIKSATFGSGSWKITLLGLFSYTSVIFGLYLGFIFNQKANYLLALLKLYCVVTALMLTSTPMEYLGIAKGWAALGTAALDADWIQTSLYGTIVNMVAGFYRSPDVMGWHATALSMLSIILATNAKGKQRYIWIALAGWGLIGSILCGRRKMFFMLPAFISALTFIYFSVPNRFKLASVIAIISISLLSGAFLYHRIGPSVSVEKYYFQKPDVVFGRIEKHSIDSVIGTYIQSGIFGEGLGTATQGAQHISASRPRTWQEGGLSRVMVETGLPGFICFIYLTIILFFTIWYKIIKNPVFYDSADFSLRAGLTAFIFANAISFIVSHQIFGDPLIICFVSILFGSILSPLPSDQAQSIQVVISEKQTKKFISSQKFLNKNTKLKSDLLKT
jgi:hypothetical protein